MDGQAAALLRCALENAATLGLDDRQVAALARMHWGDTRASELVPAIGALLTEAQFHDIVSRLIEVPAEAPAPPAPTREAIEVMVVAALEKTTKDRALVETELATRVAEKLVGWGKLFGVFAALPVAGLLLILSLFGISKFEDLRTAADRADALVKQAETKATEGGARFDVAEQKIRELTSRVSDRADEVTRQLAQLENNSKATEAKIRELGGAVDASQTATSAILAHTGIDVKEVQAQLKKLGLFQGELDGLYGPATVAAVRAFQEKNALTADGVVSPQTYSLLLKEK